MEGINEQYPALLALTNDPSLSKNASTTLKKCLFSFEEQQTVESLLEILQPFEKATTIVCADKTPTIQKVLPVVTKLLRIIQVA